MSKLLNDSDVPLITNPPPYLRFYCFNPQLPPGERGGAIEYQEIVSSGGSGNSLNVIKTSGTFTAVSNTIYLINGLSTVTLPSNPNNDDIIIFADYNGSSSQNTGFSLAPLTINTGGQYTIQGENQIVLNEDNENISLVYHTGKWVIYSAVG